jgi:hypothetical protein
MGAAPDPLAVTRTHRVHRVANPMNQQWQTSMSKRGNDEDGSG